VLGVKQYCLGSGGIEQGRTIVSPRRGSRSSGQTLDSPRTEGLGRPCESESPTRLPALRASKNSCGPHM
jgi:hypothetical protein